MVEMKRLVESIQEVVRVGERIILSLYFLKQLCTYIYSMSSSLQSRVWMFDVVGLGKSVSRAPANPFEWSTP